MTKLPNFAARLNSFVTRPELHWPGKNSAPTPVELMERAASVRGLNAVDLNYPDHIGHSDPRELGARVTDLGLTLNGFAMRYYSDREFKAGAFTNADPAVRRRAIDLTKRGIDAVRAAGGDLMTIWPGQDGFDYPFEVDYARLWDFEVEGIRAVAAHDPDCLISIEYKPNEPRSVYIIPNVAATLLAIDEAGCSNLGVTLDLGHVFQADESPAMAAAMVSRRSRLLGLHMNDGYGKRDDGLMVGAVHTTQTMELLRQIRRDGYDRALYFDTFPDISGMDPVAESEANIATIEGMYRALDRIPDDELDQALARHDTVRAHRIVQNAIFGPRG